MPTAAAHRAPTLRTSSLCTPTLGTSTLGQASSRRPRARGFLAAAGTLLALALGLSAPVAASADLGPPRVLRPRPQKPAKPTKPAVARPEVLQGVIKRHPRAGTKEEMLTGRYHLYSGTQVRELIGSAAVSEAKMDAVAGKRVSVTVRRREIAEDRNTDVPVQRPVGGLPARTVYDLIALKVL